MKFFVGFRLTSMDYLWSRGSHYYFFSDILVHLKIVPLAKYVYYFFFNNQLLPVYIYLFIHTSVVEFFFHSFSYCWFHFFKPRYFFFARQLFFFFQFRVYTFSLRDAFLLKSALYYYSYVQSRSYFLYLQRFYRFTVKKMSCTTTFERVRQNGPLSSLIHNSRVATSRIQFRAQVAGYTRPPRPYTNKG